MVRHGLKHIFQKPTPDIDASDRTQQLRSKTIYAGTVDLAKTLSLGNNIRYKTYNGPYEVSNQTGNSNLVASQSYDDLLAITKGKVLLNQLPLNSYTQDYYQKNFAKGQMYEGNYNRFDPSFNFIGHTGCNNSVLLYDISQNGFTNPPPSYNTSGGFIGATGPTGSQNNNNKNIFIDPNHCYYSDPCLLDASYTRFVSPNLTGTTGPAQFNAQQIINADQYRCFSYPMPNFTLTCVQQSVTSLPIIPLNINIYNKNSSATIKSYTDTPSFNGNGNDLVFGYTDTVNTTGNYYVSSATNPSLTYDNTKPLYLHFFTPLTNPTNPNTNPNTQVWTQYQTYLKGTALLTFVPDDSKYVSTSDNNFVLQAGQTYWTIWSQYTAGSFIASTVDTKLSMLIADDGTGKWQWQGSLTITKI
jgi:hypothetical protein